MAPKYQDYLAASVLNEGVIVNYRMLSRAVKVHNNTAKEMLYDFHRTQNARKTNSLHATYLLAGSRKPLPNSQTNGTPAPNASDGFMTDAFASSSIPTHEQDIVQPVSVTSITLVAEEHLEAVKALYESITSIHIYSLEPGPLSNIQILADCNRKVATEYAQEDPLTDWKQYGTIHNPEAKRRTTRRPVMPAPAAAPATAGMKPAAKPATASTTKPAAESSRPTSKSGPEATKDETKKPATLKRDSSSLFKSFAKTKPPAAKKEASTSDRSAAASDDEPMHDVPSEDEDDVTQLPPAETAESRAKAEASRMKRQEAETNLKAMMDASDSEDADALPGINPDENAKDQEGDSVMNEAEETAEETGALDVNAATKPLEKVQEQDTTVAGGRRRGRRRVMKKKTTKDAEGYLVTKEEPVWESFSEDEEPAVTKLKPVVAAPASAGVKKSAGAQKKGQGNIMNFFGKK